jgi:dGTPase
MPQLAKFATHHKNSFGRIHPEQGVPSDFEFALDRERIIHSTAFRRLEYKTQVFVNHVGDHYRTRLTHSLEVSQIARSIARALKVNEDLAEIIALCHDIGHPPFGHAGEYGLQEAAAEFGGFDHNAHAIKIVTEIEQGHIGFNGLNLTLNALDGLAKHNGPVPKNSVHVYKIAKSLGINPNTHSSIEAQIAALSDDIAYINHDIDDGIRADMFDIEEICQIDLVNSIFRKLSKKYHNQPVRKIINEMIRELVEFMKADLVAQTRIMIKNYGVETLEDAMNCGVDIVSSSEGVEKMKLQLKAFLMEKVYRNYKVNRMMMKSKTMIQDMYSYFTSHPECLPTNWYKKMDIANKKDISTTVIDYIAGMTDRFAIDEHKKIFDQTYF